MNNLKVIDSMFGFAIGDAIGVPAEFKSRDSLKKKPISDMIGYGTHHQPEGTWSDDTSMTIATVDSINENCRIDYDDIMSRFIEWEMYSKYTATGVFFDIGITTRNALHKYEMGIPVLECGENGIRSNGNGSLMRILPVVLYCYYNNISNDDEIELINNVSSLTHAHEISKLGCKIYSDYIKSLLNNESKSDAYQIIKNNDYSKYYSKDSLSYYDRILKGNIGDLKEDEIKSSGFIVDSLEASLWAVLNGKDYKDTVLKAVNLGEDTDTIGAITGSIAGIIYGYNNIPDKWKNNLKNKEYLRDLCIKFESILSNENKLKM